MSTHSSGCTRAVGFLLAVIGAGGLAQAQPVVPAAVNTAQAPSVSQDPQAFIARWRPGVDAPIAGPNHPPISQIPPMPMPEVQPGEVLLPQQIGTVTIYDAESGELHEIPLGDPSEAPDISPAPPGANAFRGYEMSRTNVPMTPVTAATLGGFPISANVKLIMRFVNNAGNNDYFQCSGAMQDAGVVLTAAHCIYDRDAAYTNNPLAREVWVYPGWDGASDGGMDGPGAEEVIQKFGWARSWTYIYGTDYATSGNYDSDAALLQLLRTDTRNVGMLTNWYGWARNVCTTSLDVYNYCYPGETCDATRHTGRQMYFWSGTPDQCPGVVFGDNLFRFNTFRDCLQPIWQGMSGGNLYYVNAANRYAVGVCSHRLADFSQMRYCALWRGFTDAIESLKASCRGNVFDAEALKYRISGATTFPAGSQVTTGSFVMTNPTNNDPPSRTYTIRIYLSDNNNISETDTLLSTQVVTYDFGPLASLFLTNAAYTVPANTPPGNYWIGVVLDPATDTNFDNNDTDAWDAQPVTIQPCQLPAAPGNVIATDGTSCDRISISWNAVPGATSYRVYRNTTNSTAGASDLGSTAGTIFDDLTPALGTTYYYFVRATSDCGQGGYSIGDSGFRRPLPPAVTGLAASDGQSCGGVNVTWNSIPNVSGYYVYRNTVNDTTTAIFLGSAVTNSYTDATANPGTTYFFFARAYNSCGTGPYSNADAGSRLTTPAPPTGIAASNGTLCAGVNVQWNASAGASSYQIFRNIPNNSATAVQVGVSGSSPFLDTSAVLGTTYWYWVKASNSCGQSGFSSGDAGYKANPPGAPTGVTASDGAVCTPAITISWNPVANATAYQIWRHTSNNQGSATLIASVAEPPYDDTTAAPNLPYYYWVKTVSSCISGGVSGFSAVDAGNRGTAPAAPGGVSATDGTRCRSVSVFWNPAPGATGYQVFRNTVNNANTAAFLGGSAASPYIDNSVVGTTTYFYFVKATSSCGISGASIGNSGFAGNALVIDIHPQDVIVAEGGHAEFFANAGGATGFQWKLDGVPLNNGGAYAGVNTRTLVIDPASPLEEGTYTCSMTSPCGAATSNGADLTVQGVACPADFNQDGGVDGADVQDFYAAWEAGDASADVNQDGGVDGQDVDFFFAAWEQGGC